MRLWKFGLKTVQKVHHNTIAQCPSRCVGFAAFDSLREHPGGSRNRIYLTKSPSEDKKRLPIIVASCWPLTRINYCKTLVDFFHLLSPNLTELMDGQMQVNLEHHAPLLYVSIRLR